MATTTYLANPTITVNTKSLTDQCKSVVVTKSREALETTAFGSTDRRYTGGLNNHTVTATFLMAYSTDETWDVLTSIVGTTTSVVVAAGGKTFNLGNTYCESFDVVNANLGELSEVEVTFTGGDLTES
jgi:hypothetical protein